MMHRPSIKVYEMDSVLRNPNFVAKLRELSLGGYSGMNSALNVFQAHYEIRSIDAKAILVHIVSNYGEESLENAHGWALWTQDPSTDAFRTSPGISFQVYVRPEHRRKGLASLLLKKACELSGKQQTMVYWHDAPDFFQLHQNQGLNVVNFHS